MPTLTLSLMSLSWMTVSLLAFDTAAIRQEPNLERRSELALANADTVLRDLSRAYADGDLEKTKSEASEIEESVTLAYESLNGSGKEAHHNPKSFKHAEVTTRELLRRLDSAIEAMSVQDRAILLVVRDRVSDIHDELLNAIMRKKP